MNKKQILWTSFFIVILLFALFILYIKKEEIAPTQEEVQTYSCPMHPQIVAQKPGFCPICGMDLTLFEKKDTEKFLILTPNQEYLANLTTKVIGDTLFSSFSRLNGRLITNPDKTIYISSRVSGRIEELYVKETAIPILKGQPLYKIYSEQLSTLEQEYLLSLEQLANFPKEKHFEQMKEAARQKLLLYGQSEKQLDELIKNKKTSPYIIHYSPYSGTVAEISINEGQYVEEGSSIIKLEDYTHLWVEADVYPSDMDRIKIGQKVTVIISGYEDQPQTMTIDFINPALQFNKQIIQIRGSIKNYNNQWQVGLQSIVLLPYAEKKKTLTLPVDVVIRDRYGAHVWVEEEKGRYYPRKVAVGEESFDKVEIIAGLKKGEVVVITGAYLLYSEFILKKGKNPISETKI